MTTYKYTVQDKNGKKSTHTIDVNSPAELHQYVQKNDQILVSYKEINKKTKTRKLSYRDLGDFCRQLGTMQASGISLVRALNIITHGESLKPWQREIYTKLMNLIIQGNSLSSAMEEVNGAFPELLINMYRSAEMSGNIEKTSMQMCDYYEKQYLLNKRVTSALVYPAILIILVIVVVIFLVTFIIPQLEPVLSTLDTMPLPTRILLGTSHFIIDNWIIILLAAAILAVGFAYLMKVKSFRIQFDKMLIHLPYFGRLLKTIYTARFSRTIASLYASGLPIVSALSVGGRTIGNKYVESQFDDVVAQVRGGQSLSSSIRNVDGFVSKLADTTLVGEETGKLADMLVSTSEVLEYEADIAITKLVSSMEPVLIIIMGFLVGFVMVSVLLPIYQSYSAVGAQSGM